MSLPKSPSTLNSQPSTFIFPPSVQSDLWNYLKPQQQEVLKPILRLIKRPYQTQLCTSILDYMEGNGLDQLDEPLLDKLQHNIIEVCEIHPLRVSEIQSPKVSCANLPDVIRNIFPSFKG